MAGTKLSMSSWRIPLTDLDYGDEELAAIERVVRSKWLSMGPEVAQFEQEFAAHHRVAHAIAVSSATAAMHLSYVAAGIGPGDEVIQPALNFVAAANLTVLVGATPVFADILGHEEPTLDPARVRRLVAHPAFDLRNPNKVYALIRSFGANHVRFHAADGSGYQFLAEQIVALDAINPQIAARIARSFDRWKKFDPRRRALARAALERIRDSKGLSRDVAEIVTKALA